MLRKNQITMPSSDDKNKILDEYFDEIINEGNKNIKHAHFFNKLKRFKFLGRFFIFAAALLFAFLVFSVITAPPSYSDRETEMNEKIFNRLVEGTGKFEPLFIETLPLLKQYPYFYKKVVNNIKSIEIKKNMSSPMSIYLTFGKGALSINQSYFNYYQDNYKFASSLIHEADHAEYVRSGRLRKMALALKCNALTNPNISINSGLPSLGHRLKPIEICAEKEQIKFHKKTNTQSGYEAKFGIVNGLFGAMKNAFLFLTSFARAIFTSIF